MLDLSVTEFRSIAKNRGIKGYNNLDKDELLKTILLSAFPALFSLKTKMKKSILTYNRVRAFYYKLHKISINRSGGSYIDSPDCIKNKKATINPKNKNDNKCMQYAILLY